MKKTWTFMSMLLLFMIWGTIFVSISSSISNNSVYAQEDQTNKISNQSSKQSLISKQSSEHNWWLRKVFKTWFSSSEFSNSNSSLIKSGSFFEKTVSNISDNLSDTIKTSKQNFLNKNIFSKDCQPVVFKDISWHKYQSNIQSLASDCIVKWTINRDTFYPDNFLRRADLLTIMTKSYQKYFINTQKWLNFVYFSDVQTWTKLFQIVQASNYIWIVELLIWKNKNKIWLNEFVSKSDVIRIITLLNTVKPVISDRGLQILFNKKWYITRWELAYVVSESLKPKDGKGTKGKKMEKKYKIEDYTKKQTDKLKNYPWLQGLVELWVLNSNDFLVKNPEYAITRKQFLTLLVRVKSTLNKSIPVSVPNMNYFADLEEWTWMSVITQAKNMWLTSFFEESRRGKIYLNPNKFVSEYEASVVINQIAKNHQTEDKTKDNVFVQNEKVAQMILIAFNLKNSYDFIEKKSVWDVVDIVKWRFWSEK